MNHHILNRLIRDDEVDGSNGSKRRRRQGGTTAVVEGDGTVGSNSDSKWVRLRLRRQGKEEVVAVAVRAAAGEVGYGREGRKMWLMALKWLRAAATTARWCRSLQLLRKKAIEEQVALVQLATVAAAEEGTTRRSGWATGGTSDD
ncbi:hypothetical protein BHE74_00044116 [Ensete ventricosum]|nr:hypothetical protein BHE74_00044116 [Ensete ventricosum]